MRHASSRPPLPCLRTPPWPLHASAARRTPPRSRLPLPSPACSTSTSRSYKELVVSIGGYRYVVFAIDEHSRFVFVDFIKVKSDVQTQLNASSPPSRPPWALLSTSRAALCLGLRPCLTFSVHGSRYRTVCVRPWCAWVVWGCSAEVTYPGKEDPVCDLSWKGPSFPGSYSSQTKVESRKLRCNGLSFSLTSNKEAADRTSITSSFMIRVCSGATYKL
jgi:hypothetical protein